MALFQTVEAYKALSEKKINDDGTEIKKIFHPYTGVIVDAIQFEDEPIPGVSGWPPNPKNKTLFVTIRIPGSAGKISNTANPARTLGIIGRLGGIGARPEIQGLVSDADGAIAAIGVALKIAQMRAAGDPLKGDVIVSTHFCTHAPYPPNTAGIKALGMPVRTETINDHQIDADMDAILSLDTSKGNSLIKHRGFAISPTVMQGVILPVAPDLVAIMQATTGEAAKTFPLSQHDITWYHNDLPKFNSIMQPHIGTDKPVVGVAITAQSVVYGHETNASREMDIAPAVQFSIEVAQRFGAGNCRFYDPKSWERLKEIFPITTSMTQFKDHKDTDAPSSPPPLQ